MKPAGLLEIDALDAGYGRGRVLQGVSVAVERAGVVALLGRNGAGKSTTLKAVMGIVAAAGGSVRFDGEAIHHLAPHRIARRGIAYVPEERGIFPSLTVEEHLRLGPRRRRGNGGRFRIEAVYEDFPGLAARRRHRGRELSGGEQQMLAIARALTLSPRLLLLDEPSEGLAPVMVEQVARIVQALKASGMTMLLVEQNHPFALDLSDRVYVLGKGRVRWQGSAPALRADAGTQAAWLGV